MDAVHGQLAVFGRGAGGGWSGQGQDGRAAALVSCFAGAGERDAGLLDGPGSLCETVGAVVEGVVVGEADVVDSGGGQRGDGVGGVHAVVEGFVGPGRVGGCGGGFEVDEVEVGGVEERERGAPGVVVRVGGEVGVVVDEVGDDALLACVVDVLWPELVDEAAEHHVAD